MFFDTINKAIKLLSSKEKIDFLYIVILAIGMAVFEVTGVASVLPFLSVLSDPEIISTNMYLKWLYDWTGLNDITNFLLFLGGAAVSVLILAACVRTFGQYVLIRYAQMRRHSIGSRLLGSYLGQPYEFFLNRHSGELAKGVISEVEQVVNEVYTPITILVSQAFTLLFLICLLIFVDPAVALISGVVLTIIYSLIFLGVRGVISEIGEKKIIANQKRFEATTETLGGIKEIKLLDREEDYLRRFEIPSGELAHYVSLAQVLSQVPKYFIEAIAFGGILIISLVLLVRFGGHESNSLGQILPLLGLYAFAGYRLLPSGQGIYQAVTQIRFGSAAINNLLNDFENSFTDKNKVSPFSRKLELKHQIKIDSISYSYPDTKSSCIENLSLVIPKGGTIGVVGETGSGKTTLIDLLLALLNPDKGRIFIDEIALDYSHYKNWQANIGYVAQDIFLIDESIAANIAMSSNSECIDLDRVIECATAAQLNEFVCDELQAGYDTEVGERGVRLSGGQKQRIGIARALYRNPSVLVFDEATSALDNFTEKRVIEGIKANSYGKTLIMIAHRLSTLAQCDQIVVLDNGRICGLGSYGSLLEENEIFKRLASTSNA